MKLSEYLAANHITYTAFAKATGYDIETVRRWAIGKRFPGREPMEKIREVTGGQVQPNDFLDADASPPPADAGGAPPAEDAA